MGTSGTLPAPECQSEMLRVAPRGAGARHSARLKFKSILPVIGAALLALSLFGFAYINFIDPILWGVEREGRANLPPESAPKPAAPYPTPTSSRSQPGGPPRARAGGRVSRDGGATWAHHGGGGSTRLGVSAGAAAADALTASSFITAPQVMRLATAQTPATPTPAASATPAAAASPNTRASAAPPRKRNAVIRFFSWFWRKLSGGKPDVLPNNPPTVTVASSSARVTLAANCGPEQMPDPACTPTSSTVQLTANATDPDGDTLLYDWSSTGGRIVGDGPNVIFDLTGASPGAIYGAEITVSDGEGVEARDSTQVMVSVSRCSCVAAPTPSPSASPDVTVTPTPSDVGPTPTPTPPQTPTPRPSPSPRPTEFPSATPTAAPSISPEPTPTFSGTPSTTPSVSPTQPPTVPLRDTVYLTYPQRVSKTWQKVITVRLNRHPEDKPPPSPSPPPGDNVNSGPANLPPGAMPNVGLGAAWGSDYEGRAWVSAELRGLKVISTDWEAKSIDPEEVTWSLTVEPEDGPPRLVSGTVKVYVVWQHRKTGEMFRMSSGETVWEAWKDDFPTQTVETSLTRTGALVGSGGSGVMGLCCFLIVVGPAHSRLRRAARGGARKGARAALLYINIWFERPGHEPLAQPVRLAAGRTYHFVFAIESRLRDYSVVRETFDWPDELSDEAFSTAMLEVVCPFLEGDVDYGYAAREVLFQRDLGFVPEKFSLRPKEPGTYYLTARLWLAGEIRYRTVQTVTVHGSGAAAFAARLLDWLLQRLLPGRIGRDYFR